MSLAMRFQIVTVTVLSILLVAALRGQLQPLKVVRFPSYVVALESVDQEQFAHFNVSWNDGRRVEFKIFGVIADASERERISVSTFLDKRLIINDSMRHDYFIVDPSLGSVVDQFVVGDNAAISQDSRFVAFENMIGRGNAGEGAVYSIYDVSLAPHDNRWGGSQPKTPRGIEGGAAGWEIYPEENRLTHSRKAAQRGSSGFRESRSALTWIDTRTLAFVDYADGLVKVVLAKFGENAHQLSVDDRIIDPMSVLDSASIEPGKSASDYITVTWIGRVTVRGRDVVRITFPGDNGHFRQSLLDVPF